MNIFSNTIFWNNNKNALNEKKKMFFEQVKWHLIRKLSDFGSRSLDLERFHSVHNLHVRTNMYKWLLLTHIFRHNLLAFQLMDKGASINPQKSLLDSESAQPSHVVCNEDPDCMADIDDSATSTTGDEMSLSDMKKWKRVFEHTSSDGAYLLSSHASIRLMLSFQMLHTPSTRNGSAWSQTRIWMRGKVRSPSSFQARLMLTNSP